MERELRHGGLDVITLCVETEPEFVAALVEFRPDIVLSDYSLPSFNGMDALQLVQQHSPTTPLIIVTGSLTEETAAECIKAGAADYVLKEHLARLLPAVRGALERQRLAEDKRQVEEELRESEERYRLIFDRGLDAVLLTAPDGTIFAANPAACLMFGREESEICELGRSAIIDATDPRLAAALAVRARTGSFSGELTGLRRDGAKFPVEVSSSVFADRAGNLRTSMIIRDLTEHKRAEAALLQSENQLRAMFELASVGIAQADPQTGRWLRVNQKMCAITGYTAEELLALRVPEITHPDDRQEDWEAFQRVVRGEANDYRLEKRYIRKDGSVTWVNVNMTVIRGEDGRPFQTIATIEDITERRRAEEALAASEERYRLIATSTSDGIFTLSLDGRITFASPLWLKKGGYTEADVIGRRMTDFVPEESRAIAWENFASALSGKDVPVYEIELLESDGARRPVEISVSNLTDATGEVIGRTGVFRDISERQRADEALRQSEARFKAAFASSPIGMALVAPDGRFLEVNSAICQIVGYAEEELLAKTFQDITHPDDLDSDLTYVRQILTGEIPTYQMEKRYLHKQGQVVSALLSVSLVRDDAGQPLYFVSQIQDITERKRAAQALRESEERYRLIVGQYGRRRAADARLRTGGSLREPFHRRLRGCSHREVIAKPFEAP